MGLLNLPNAGHPVNGEDLDADVLRGQINQLLGYLQALDLSNATAGSLSQAAFDTNTSPTLWRQDSFPSYITAGGLPSGFTGLGLSIPAISSAYFASTGARLQSISGGSYTVAINNDTYFSLGPNGAIDIPQGISNNAAAPSLPSGSQWLFRAISNGTAIQSIVDMRTLHAVTPNIIHNPYKFSVYLAAAVSSYMTTGGVYYITKFDTKLYDTGNNFNTTNWTFTAPVAGWYRLGAKVGIQNGTNNSGSSIQFLKNGTTAIDLASQTFSSVNGNPTSALGGEYQLAANDTIVVQTNHGINNIGLNGGQAVTWFSGDLVSAS